MIENSCQFIGTIYRQEPLAYTQNNKKVVKLVVSVRVGKDQNGKGLYEYFPCRAYEGTADLLANYFGDGKPIILQAHAHRYKFTDQSKIERTVTEFIIDAVTFVPREFVKDPEPAQQPQYAPAQQQAPYDPAEPQWTQGYSVNPDDLPF